MRELTGILWFILLNEFFGFIGGDVLVKIIIDHYDGARATGCEAFGKFHRPITTRRNGNGVMVGMEV